MVPVRVRWLVTGAWMLVIFALSSIPGSRIPGRFTVEAHVLEYLVLGCLAAWAASGTLRLFPAAVAGVLLATAYAATDELHQLFVPGRQADPFDLAADAAGALLGAAAAWLVLLRRES